MMVEKINMIFLSSKAQRFVALPLKHNFVVLTLWECASGSNMLLLRPIFWIFIAT